MTRSQLAILIQDVVKFYSQIQRHHLSSLEAFEQAWERNRMEYLHYAGATSLVPYHPHVIEHLFCIAVAYASMPLQLSDRAVRFGCLLMYFLHFTQPAINSGARYVLKVRIPVDAVKQLLELGERDGATSVVSLVLAQLTKANALHIVPFVDSMVVTQELFKAHDAAGIPLIPVDMFMLGSTSAGGRRQVAAPVTNETTTAALALKCLPSDAQQLLLEYEEDLKALRTRVGSSC